MAYQCDRCQGWTPNNVSHKCIHDKLKKIEEERDRYKAALEQIANPSPNTNLVSDIELLGNWCQLAIDALSGNDPQ